MKNEGEINPQEVWGKYFRVPCITGFSSGKGFGFQYLNLPRRWEEVISTINHDHFKRHFESFCHNAAGRFGLTIQSIFWSEKTGILTSISVKEGSGCCIYLEHEFPFQNGGEYCRHNVDTFEQAFVFFQIVTKFINEILDRIYGLSR